MKLEINYMKKTGKFTNVWRLNKMLLNNKWVKEEIKREIKIYLRQTKLKYTYQNLWDATKAVLKGKFIVINAYFKKQEKSQINNLTFHLKKLENEGKKKPRISRREEILKIQQ